MAERHTIIVCVRDGEVGEVLLCDCCPSVTLEVRTYTESKQAAAVAAPIWYMGGGESQPSRFTRDERGVYEVKYHEKDADS